MDSEDKGITKVFGQQTFSSSSQSTQEKKEDSYAASRSEEILNEYPNSGPKKESHRTCFGKERKEIASSKSNVVYQYAKTSKKRCRNQESRKNSCGQLALVPHQSSKKQQRKGETPVGLPTSTEMSPYVGSPNTLICKNSACRATLNSEDAFCKRCSCCICHLFDDNKDPSLWLVCTSEYGEQDSCGLSCHLECAFKRQKVGVVDLGESMQLDGSYCCASCGKVRGILGCWKKQLMIAKDARRVDALCYRISVSYRLLDGTSRFKELHEIVRDAKDKLEAEVGAVNGDSANMGRGIVSRLPVAGGVQKLCSLAIEMADAWESSIMNANPNDRQDSLPAACRFQFEEVTSSSLVLLLKDFRSSSSDDIKGYKLWYCKSRDEAYTKEPNSVFPRSLRRISVSNLQPCTEYIFRIVSHNEAGDLGHSESKCFTKSVEIIHKEFDSRLALVPRMENVDGSSSGKRDAVGSSGFKVRKLGNVLRNYWAQEECSVDGFCNADTEEFCGGNSSVRPEAAEEDKPSSVVSRFDLNVAASVPDLNIEPLDSYRDDDIGCTSQQAAEVYDDVVSHGTEKNGLVRSNGSNDSQYWLARAIREVPAVESQAGLRQKRTSNSTEEGDSTLINGSPLHFSGASFRLDENYEDCIRIIRWLERGGHIDQEFRKKFLTWYSLRSADPERRVVNTFIRTMMDDPQSLAEQLVDSFTDIVSRERHPHGFCSKLWH